MALDLAAIEGMKMTFRNSILNEIESTLEENSLKKYCILRLIVYTSNQAEWDPKFQRKRPRLGGHGISLKHH